MYQNGHSLKLRSLLNEVILFHLRSISLNGILTGDQLPVPVLKNIPNPIACLYHHVIPLPNGALHQYCARFAYPRKGNPQSLLFLCQKRTATFV